MHFGLGEIIVIVFVLVVVFSASRMGQLGNALGKFVYSFKKASRGEDLIDARRVNGKLEARRSRQSEDAQIVEGERRRD